MSRTLFLADDSVTIQRVVELTFAHEDVRVVSIGDGRKAVQWLESERPDIVLVDVDLPDVDGFEIAARVRKSPRLRQVPVLLLAGAFEAVDEERARTAGTDGVVIKPFEPQQLVSRVKELLAAAGGRQEPGRGPRPAAVSSMGEGSTAPPLHVASSRMIEPAAAPQPTFREQRAAASGGLGGGYNLDPPLRSEPAMRQDPLRATDPPLRAVPGFPTLTQTAPPPPEPLEPPARPVWETSMPAAQAAPVPPAPAPGHPRPLEPARPGAAAPKVSLSNAFSALLAAEQTSPNAAPAPATTVIISESAIEDAVRRVLVKMTDDLVHRIVHDTAERLIREELEKIKQESE